MRLGNSRAGGALNHLSAPDADQGRSLLSTLSRTQFFLGGSGIATQPVQLEHRRPSPLMGGPWTRLTGQESASPWN